MIYHKIINFHFTWWGVGCNQVAPKNLQIFIKNFVKNLVNFAQNLPKIG
jgi:hypothetical protein